MKRTIALIAILLLLPFSCNPAHAITRADTSEVAGARLAGGFALENGAPHGALAFVTRIGPSFYNATSLLSAGKEGGLESQVFWHVYKTDGFSIALGLGATADIIRENPTFDNAILYAAATPGFAITYKITSDLILHGSLLYLTPSEPGRKFRAFLVVSFPIQSR
jgi:hypothetical protein